MEKEIKAVERIEFSGAEYASNGIDVRLYGSEGESSFSGVMELKIPKEAVKTIEVMNDYEFSISLEDAITCKVEKWKKYTNIISCKRLTGETGEILRISSW